MKEFILYYKDKDNGSASQQMTCKVQALTALAATNILDRKEWIDSHSVQMYKVEEVVHEDGQPLEYRASKFYVNYYVNEEDQRVYARMITEHTGDGQILSHLVKTEEDLEIIPIQHAVKPWPYSKCNWYIAEFMGSHNFIELEVI